MKWNNYLIPPPKFLTHYFYWIQILQMVKLFNPTFLTNLPFQSVTKGKIVVIHNDEIRVILNPCHLSPDSPLVSSK